MDTVHDALLTTTWRSPSNIALVKYWGKYGRQLPANPSISFTLSRAFTETQVHFYVRTDVSSPILKRFLFDGEANSGFAARIEKYLREIQGECPILQTHQLSVSSTNSFPHSAGIASSASAMSALALCIAEGEYALQGQSFELDKALARVSELARLGSGSASRSVVGPVGVWGEHEALPGSNDRYAIPFPFVLHPNFENWRDDILLVSNAVKVVSSSRGHQLMNQHLFAEVRYRQAQENIQRLTAALRTGDVEAFGSIVEEEALTLHGLMMNSRPSYMLILPDTVRIIQALRQWRSRSHVPAYFTLDAGPNVHLLYPKEYGNAVREWLDEVLPGYARGTKIMRDKMGTGPEKV